MIEYFLLTLGFVGLVIASLSDIKTREVPDWLNYSLIASGLGIRLIYSIITSIWQYFLYALLALGIVFVIVSIMYYTKQWGGGDSKLLIALAVLFAYMPEHNLFFIKLVINILIVGAAYGILYSLYFIIKNTKKVAKEFKKRVRKFHKISFIILIILLIVGLFIPDPKIKFLIVTAFLLLLFYQFLSLLMKSVEKACLYKIIPISKLTEGDWITKDIYINKKIIYKKSSPGVEKKQIALLKKYKIKKVPIKEGIPFVPAFLIAFIVTLFTKSILEIFI